MDLCTCCLRRNDYPSPVLPSALQHPGCGEPGSCGMWQSRASPLQSRQFTLLPPLHTRAWAIMCFPGSSAGKGGNLWPSQCPHCTPASALCCRGGRAAGPEGSPGTQGFPRNGSRERGWKVWRLVGGNGLCIKEKDRSRITRRLLRTAEGNMLLFHQLYSPLNNTGGCGMVLQEVENHPFKMLNLPSPTGMRKGKPARIEVLWQPNTHMTRILPIWSPQNHKFLF